MSLLRAGVIIIGVGFCLPGVLAVFQTDRLGEFLSLNAASPTGQVSIKVLIGAPYLAMAAICIFAAVKSKWSWLAPVAAIEGAMCVVRIYSGLIYGFEAAGTVEILIEITVCIFLAICARQDRQL